MAREQYENSWKDYYQVLQLHPHAEPEVIAAAYRRLAMIYHPDRNKSPEAESRFKEINEANEVLSDSERRAAYDLAYQRAQNGHHTAQDYQDYSQEDRHYREKARWEYDDPRAYRDQGGRHDHTGEYGSGSSWYEDDMAWTDQVEYPNHHRPRPDSLFSFAFLRYLMNSLVDRLAPNPDESQRILPWPSWRWQRVWLMAAPPLAGMSFLFALFNGAWAAVVFALIFLAASIYSGKMTGWMREANVAPMVARVSAGASIALSGTSWVLGIGYVVFAIIMFVVFFRLAGVMLMAMLEGGLGRR